MRRRDFLAVLLGGAAQRPNALRAAARTARIAILWHAGSEEEEAVFLIPLRQELSTLGWVEGQNLAIENRYPAERPELFLRYASELVSLKPDLIVAVSNQAALAAHRATTTIPIVFISVTDPVGLKLVQSLAHPGGNITGTSNVIPDIEAKRLQIFREAVGGLSRVGILWDRNNVVTAEGVIATAKALGLTAELAEAQKPDVLESAFAKLVNAKVNGVFVLSSTMFFNERKRIGDFALINKLPTAVFDLEMTRAGGLIFYGASFVNIFRRAAHYMDNILRGAMPAHLPVEQPTIFELAINIKTATALNLMIPAALLSQATELID